MRLEYRLVRRCICCPDPSTSKNSKAIDRRTRLGSRPVACMRIVRLACALGGGTRTSQDTHGQKSCQCISLEILSHPIHTRLDAQRHYGLRVAWTGRSNERNDYAISQRTRLCEFGFSRRNQSRSPQDAECFAGSYGGKACHSWWGILPVGRTVSSCCNPESD